MLEKKSIFLAVLMVYVSQNDSITVYCVYGGVDMGYKNC